MWKVGLESFRPTEQNKHLAINLPTLCTQGVGGILKRQTLLRVFNLQLMELGEKRLLKDFPKFVCAQVNVTDLHETGTRIAYSTVRADIRLTTRLSFHRPFH